MPTAGRSPRSRSSIPMRVLRGKPVIDVNDVLTVSRPRRGRHERLLSGTIALHCIATDVDSARPSTCTGCARGGGLDGVLASSRMPWAGGPPVEIDGTALPRRRDDLAGPGRRGDRRGRHARAGAADAAVRDSAQERVADRRPPDRAPSARAQPGAGHGLPRADATYERLVDDLARPLARARRRSRPTCSACGLPTARRASVSSSATRSCSPRPGGRAAGRAAALAPCHPAAGSGPGALLLVGFADPRRSRPCGLLGRVGQFLLTLAEAPLVELLRRVGWEFLLALAELALLARLALARAARESGSRFSSGGSGLSRPFSKLSFCDGFAGCLASP